MFPLTPAVTDLSQEIARRPAAIAACRSRAATTCGAGATRAARRRSGSSCFLTGQIVHESLVLLREFQQPSADTGPRRHIRDFSEELDLLAVAGDPVTFRPGQPA